MNTIAIGAGIAAGVAGIGGFAIWRATREEPDVLQPTKLDAFAASTVRDWDRANRNGNFNGSVDVASEGVRLVHDSTSRSYSSGSRPTSDMTGIATGSKQGGYYTTVRDATYDGAAMWRAADRATGRDGQVTRTDFATWLGATYDDGDGTLQPAEQQRLFAEHPGAFTAETSYRR